MSSGGPKGSDPGEELWDAIVDDILEQGAPCLETIEKLVDKACRQPPAGKDVDKPEGR